MAISDTVYLCINCCHSYSHGKVMHDTCWQVDPLFCCQPHQMFNSVGLIWVPGQSSHHFTATEWEVVFAELSAFSVA